MAVPKYDIDVPISKGENTPGQTADMVTIMGRVIIHMQKAGIPEDEILNYVFWATMGDYQNFMRITRETVKLT